MYKRHLEVTMSEKLTQCPHCQNVFRVTQSQLSAASGQVRCGSCLGTFSAPLNFIIIKPLPESDDLLSDLLSDPRAEAQIFAPYEEYSDTPDLFDELEATEKNSSIARLTVRDPSACPFEEGDNFSDDETMFDPVQDEFQPKIVYFAEAEDPDPDFEEEDLDSFEEEIPTEDESYHEEIVDPHDDPHNDYLGTDIPSDELDEDILPNQLHKDSAFPYYLRWVAGILAVIVMIILFL